MNISTNAKPVFVGVTSLLLAFICLTLSINTYSATLLISEGQLIGATNVEVQGALYDVTFIDGTCNNLFNGCATFDFGNEVQASDAATALLEQVLIGLYDTDPTLTRGIDSIAVSGFGDSLIPYARTPDSGVSYAIASNYPQGNDVVKIEDRSSGWTAVDTSDRAEQVYTQWTQSAVPLPATVWLFGSAVLGLVVAKRKST